jgi:DNA-binding transcriptional LysR family regulator
VENGLLFHAFDIFNDKMKISGSDLHLLEIFAAVVRNGGFSAAQVELGLSQPTISNHITALEQRLGVRLCQRGRRGFQLTEKGKIVHQIGQNIGASIDGHSARLAELKGSLVGTLRVGAVDSIASDVNMRLPDALFNFTEIAPMVKLELTQERPQNVLSKILNGQLHAGIGSFDKTIQGLKFERIYTEKHTLYCGPRHPLFKGGNAKNPNGGIEEYPRVNRGYWSRRRRQALSIKETDVMVDGIESQLLFVLSGRYLGLLPDHAASVYVARGELRPLSGKNADYQCDMQFVTKTGPQPKMIETFRGAVLKAHET